MTHSLNVNQTCSWISGSARIANHLLCIFKHIKQSHDIFKSQNSFLLNQFVCRPKRYGKILTTTRKH